MGHRLAKTPLARGSVGRALPHTSGPRSLTILRIGTRERLMIEILVIQIAAGLVIVAVAAASGLIAWRRRDIRSERYSKSR